jgi:hypothetical protein
MQIRHVCQSCGEVMAVHVHNAYQEVKNCLAGMKALCAQCDSWPGSPSARTDVGQEEGVDGTIR